MSAVVNSYVLIAVWTNQSIINYYLDEFQLQRDIEVEVVSGVPNSF